mmetsp:Transcript_39360/g.63065  ORF Transcript_39360/g.63065 Transcript_39360/m.63065 type:complete len:232 (-) Transcript_39360:122-817(-)
MVESQLVHLPLDLPHVVPGECLGTPRAALRVSEEVRGMKDGHDVTTVHFVPGASNLGDALRPAQDGSHGVPAREDDDRRVHQPNLLHQPPPVILNLAGGGVAVVGGSPLDHVGDITQTVGVDGDGGEDLVQQLPGPPHEGHPVQIFVRAGGLSYEHHRRRRTPPIYHNISAVHLERISGERLERRRELVDTREVHTVAIPCRVGTLLGPSCSSLLPGSGGDFSPRSRRLRR